MQQYPQASVVEAAALVTDTDDRVLLTSTRGAHHQLPTQHVGAATPPRHAAVCAVREATGLVPRLGALLLCDWRSDGTAGTGSYIFDAGTISRTAVRRIACGPSARTSLVPHHALSAVMSPSGARRVLAALRARQDRSTAYTEDGYVPAAMAAMSRFGIRAALQSGGAWTWNGGPVPEEIPIRHAWVWLFVPDGRVVVYVDRAGMLGLPGGTLEPFEGRDATAAAVREVREETNISTTTPTYIGHLVDRRPDGSVVARVRMAAVATDIGPATVDPATGTVHRRLLVPPRLVLDLCGWGPAGDPQLRAAVAAVACLGVRGEEACETVEELPAGGVRTACL
jgi:ADP-ribose pyrophosphatase YjhB (NUDIX family)